MFKAMKFKVANAEQSEQLQNVLFELGYRWAVDNVVFFATNHPCLYARKDGYLSYDVNLSDIDADYNYELTLMDTAAFILEHTEKPVSETPVQTADKQISDKPASEKTISLSTLLNEHGTPNARDLLLKAAQGPVGVNDKQPALIQAVGAYNALTGQSMTVAEGNLFMALAHVASAEGDEESALGYLARYLVPNK